MLPSRLGFRRFSSKVSSNHWINRQNRDKYVKQARIDKFRCRSAYKLLEIDEKLKFLTPGKVVVDCGCAPGSWTQVAVQRTGSDHQDARGAHGTVLGFDLLQVASVEGATVLSKLDIRDPRCAEIITGQLRSRQVDVVLSDMAPSATGLQSMDFENTVQLCASALQLALSLLRPGGVFLGKLFTCPEQQRLYTAMGALFTETRIIKPRSSRLDSAEIFVYGSGLTRSKKKNG